jgi:UPF0716 protein FxsA
LLLRLILLLTVTPIVEIVILFRLAEWISWQNTLGLVVLTGVVGAWLARREGLMALARIRSDLEAGVAPTSAVVDGVLILVAGIVLVTPGVLTDLCGFALLIAPVRRVVRRRLAEALKRRIVVIRPDAPGSPDDFIDVSAVSRDADESADPAAPDSLEVRKENH